MATPNPEKSSVSERDELQIPPTPHEHIWDAPPTTPKREPHPRPIMAAHAQIAPRPSDIASINSENGWNGYQVS
ncbi:hypothetical protein [Mesorhizobium waimense]|uniref:hypothetical protein n=1 Tax=Mesorhizobium waimense TaxID=1300307 RepID=UPI0011C4753A|nr:hypothetical protein [Mesorhizobium waimense]